MLWPWIRIAAAIVALSGVVAGLIVNVHRATRQGQDLGLVLANYFSLFTILTALLGAAALAAAAAWAMRHPGTSREPLGIALGIAVVAAPVLLLGLVFNTLLRGLPSAAALGDPAGIAALDSYAIEALHVVLPLYFLADLLFASRARGLPWWSLAVLVAYPLAWLGGTMVRGELVANPDGSAPWWYPYPFLDPHGPGGYGSVLAYIGAMLAAFLAIGAIIIAIGHYRERHASAHGARPAGAVHV